MDTATLPRIVRHSCTFSVDDSAEVIEKRIAETRANAQIVAVQEGYVCQHLTELFGPAHEDDIQALIGCSNTRADTWQDALCQCHWGRFAQYQVIVGEME